MNYYNPYFYSIPTNISTPKVGLLSRIFGNSGISIGRILNGTQKALNFANQAIPLVKQVRPMIGNAKTMFRVMNEFKRMEKPKQNANNVQNQTIKNNVEDTRRSTEEENNYIASNSGPTFFI